MRAIVVTPGTGVGVRLQDVPEPPPEAGPILVEAVALGVCGTDREIIAGEYGSAPPGDAFLVLGHESLGRVADAPPGSGFSRGDLVVGIVRRPDPAPCASCAAGEWDMCENGHYTEHGIKSLHGFGSERYRLNPRFALRLDQTLGLTGVLMEPASILAKAWDHIEHITRRATWNPGRVLVTGAGPVGLLAALLARQRGYDVTVFDRVTSGPKPQLVAALGAEYRVGSLADACSNVSVLLECTGAGPLVIEAMQCIRPNGIVCLTGLSSGHRTIPVNAEALNKELVLENGVVFGTVNANRRHYDLAAASLAQADRRWLEAMITRRVPLSRWAEAFEKRPDDVKVVIAFED
jgi:threonine dehydrogenase-like Zn-dependent dehydrogenase